jgi:hypothetical protein
VTLGGQPSIIREDEFYYRAAAKRRSFYWSAKLLASLVKTTSYS